MKNSWKWKIKTAGTIIEGYAHADTNKLDDLIDLLEAGSPSHSIEAKPGGVLRFYVREGGSWKLAHAKFIARHPGFQPNKFTERAQSKADEIVQELIPVLQSEINAIILGK